MTKELPLAWQALSRSQQAELEERIADFERLWHTSPNPDLNQFLPQDPQLAELVRSELQFIDREFRLGIGSKHSSSPAEAPKPNVDNYLERNAIRLVSNYDAPFQHHAGGLGDVWVVHEPSLGRSVVIKQLQRKWQFHARARHAFLQEVRITSLLEHSGVAPVHAVGETEDGRPCYSMRYIHGETFEEAIANYHLSGERPTAKLRELLGHFVTVCNTIAYAHSRGVLHRDLKPSNIMIGPYGQTMVIDWGLAKEFDASLEARWMDSEWQSSPKTVVRSTDTSLSRTEATQLDAEFDRLQTALGDIVGTPAFMSPEQACGDVEQISIRTDVFGLGTVLFNILYGKPPFLSSVAGGTLERAARCEVEFPELQPTHSIPVGLVAICAKAMGRSPKLRYVNADSLASDIQNWLMGEPITAAQQRLGERLVRFAGRRRTLALVASFSVLALFLTAGLAAIGLQRERLEKLLATRTAEVKAQAASDISEYLSRVFRTVDPMQFDDPGFIGSENQDAQQTLRKMLDRGAVLIDAHLRDQPEAYAELLGSLGMSYRGLADYDRAESMLNASLRIRRERFGDAANEVLQSEYFLARCAHDRGDYTRAEQQYRAIISAGNRLDPLRPLLIADVKYHLAWLLFYQPLGIALPQFNPQAVSESIQLFTEVIDEREGQLGPKDRSVGLAYAGLAAARMCFSEQPILAQLSAVQAMEILNASEQESALGSFLLTYQRAEYLRNEERGFEAEKIYLQLKETISKHVGERHPIYIIHLWNMAGHYNKFNQPHLAEATIDELRAAIKPLANLRSTPVHLDGLCQYTEALASVNEAKAREVSEEILLYSSERSKVSQPFRQRAENVLKHLGLGAAPIATNSTDLPAGDSVEPLQ